MNYNKIIILCICTLFFTFCAHSQSKPRKLTLSECLQVAKQRNISIKQDSLTLQQSMVNTWASRQALLPDLNASTSQNISAYAQGQGANMNKTAYSGSYGLNSSVTLWQGGKLRNDIKANEKQDTINSIAIKGQIDDISTQIIECYINILYAYESVATQEDILSLSSEQLKRSESLLKAGSISNADYAQLQSQDVSYQYQLVQAKNTLQSNKLALKQLLNMTTEDIDVVIPQISDEQILSSVPDMQTLYSSCYNHFASLKSAQYNIELARLQKDIAKGGYLPTLSANASLSTGNTSSNNAALATQLKSSFFGSAGLTMSIPLLSKGENKAAVSKANIGISSAKLSLDDAKIKVWNTLETLYLEATSNQSSYVAAKAKVASQQTTYTLIERQFNLGMKSTIELMTGRNELLTAKSQMSQAKFKAFLSTQLIQFYQDKELNY
jgi:Outer membrane protein